MYFLANSCFMRAAKHKKNPPPFYRLKTQCFRVPRMGEFAPWFFLSNTKYYYTVLAFSTLILFKLQRLSLEVLSVTSKHTKTNKKSSFATNKKTILFSVVWPLNSWWKWHAWCSQCVWVCVCVCVCLTLHDKEYLRQRYFSFCHLDILSLLKNI